MTDPRIWAVYAVAAMLAVMFGLFIWHELPWRPFHEKRIAKARHMCLDCIKRYGGAHLEFGDPQTWGRCGVCNKTASKMAETDWHRELRANERAEWKTYTSGFER